MAYRFDVQLSNAKIYSVFHLKIELGIAQREWYTLYNRN